MHDFDYDAMQKKHIARGAAHMKRGSKSKKCTLPSDNLTPAQLRRLNGPVSTYKLDEPMSRESFKAMPEDLQKQYILKLQETYQANDEMIGKMFGVSKVAIFKARQKLGIVPVGKSAMTADAIRVRNAKWDAFCNGVVGGKPGEANEKEEPNEPEQIEIEENSMNDKVEVESQVDILIPDHVSTSFVVDAEDIDKVFEKFKLVTIPKGKVCIRFEVEAV